MCKNQWQKVCVVKSSKERKTKITGVPYLEALRTSVVFTSKHESKILCHIDCDQVWAKGRESLICVFFERNPVFMGSSGRYSVAVSKDQTIKGNFFACVKISLCKLAHYILGQARLVKKDSCCPMHIYWQSWCQVTGAILRNLLNKL